MKSSIMDNTMTPRLVELVGRLNEAAQSYRARYSTLTTADLLMEAADAISRLMAEGGLSKEPPAAQAWKEVIETLRTLATLSIYDDDTYTSTIAVNLESDLGEVIDALTALQANEVKRLSNPVDDAAVERAAIWNEAADICEAEWSTFYGAGSQKEMQMQQFRIDAVQELEKRFRTKAAALEAAEPIQQEDE